MLLLEPSQYVTGILIHVMLCYMCRSHNVTRVLHDVSYFIQKL